MYTLPCFFAAKPGLFETLHPSIDASSQSAILALSNDQVEQLQDSLNRTLLHVALYNLPDGNILPKTLSTLIIKSAFLLQHPEVAPENFQQKIAQALWHLKYSNQPQLLFVVLFGLMVYGFNEKFLLLPPAVHEKTSPRDIDRFKEELLLTEQRKLSNEMRHLLDTIYQNNDKYFVDTLKQINHINMTVLESVESAPENIRIFAGQFLQLLIGNPIQSALQNKAQREWASTSDEHASLLRHY